MEPCGENKIIILQKSMMEPCGENKVWGKNMRKMNFVIKDETEERLRRAIADYMGVNKGNIRYIRVRKTITAALMHLSQIFVNLNCYVIKYR